MGSAKRPCGGRSLNTLPNDYVVVDVETTGLSFDWCRLIEIGAARVVGGSVVDTFSELVHVDGPLPPLITDLTGITDEMLAGAREEREVVGGFASFAGDAPLMAHNANFDMTFLYMAYEKNLGRPLANDFVDTLRVAREALPELPHHRMGDICEALNVENLHAHRALSDAIAEHECYQLMRSRLLDDLGVEGYEALLRAKPSKGLSASDIVAQGEPDEDSPLFGMNIAFTGTMSMMVRRDAMQAVKNIGGNPQNRVTRKTDYLVIGSEGFAEALGGKSDKMRAAERNQLKGLPIRVISEDAFIELLQS